jgi:hypothetical protein
LKRRAEVTVVIERRDVPKAYQLRDIVIDVEQRIKKAFPGARVIVAAAEIDPPTSEK